MCSIDSALSSQVCAPLLPHTTNGEMNGTLASLWLEVGYWRSGPESTEIQECYYADACKGGVEGHYCAEGYSGPCAMLFPHAGNSH